MVDEYALEPELVATWHDRLVARYYKEQFGLGRGRLVSRYPKAWKRLVFTALSRDDQNSIKELEALVAALSRVMVERSSSYDGSKDWLANAENENDNRPFHLILARTNPRQSAAVASAAHVEAEHEPRWASPASLCVQRSPAKLADAVSSLLRCSREIIFVDPHFRPNEIRYRSVLEAFFDTMTRLRAVGLPKRIELHVAARHIGWQAQFNEYCASKLPDVIPTGIQLRVLCLGERAGGMQLHNRYILTELGAVSFGHGLDHAEDSEGATDDVSRLDELHHQERWKQYGEYGAFERNGPPVIIDGRKRS